MPVRIATPPVASFLYDLPMPRILELSSCFPYAGGYCLPIYLFVSVFFCFFWFVLFLLLLDEMIFADRDGGCRAGAWVGSRAGY